MADDQDNDYVQINQENGETKDEQIQRLQQQIAQLQETNKYMSQRAINSDGNSTVNIHDELGDERQFSKQQSQQVWIDDKGHTREVSMPSFHKQFTRNFAEEINDLQAMDEDHSGIMTGANGATGGSVDPNDPNISIELKRAYLEIQQLTKQLAQFTEQARDERALIWEKPRLTIQQISTFLRKLPDKHKEKMWERHCMGDWVKVDKVGSLLFSIVALCIKIHDRNVKTPQKGTLLKKLEPYTKLIQSQVQSKEDPTGLTQEDFNDNLHEWLLMPLPIENLLSNNEREKLESELFETKKQLIEKDKEIFKERRKSKIFQESLQEIQKDAERYEEVKKSTEDVENLKRRASQIMDEKDQLKLELIEKDRTIQELQGEVHSLTTKLNKSRDSEDDNELPDTQPNGHSVYSRIENNPFEEEKMDYSINDNNIIKSDIYLGWKKKAEKWEQMLKAEQDRADKAESQAHNYEQSIEEMQKKIQEYQTMAEAYRNLQSDNTKWKEKVQTMTDKMNEFDKQHSSKTARRESIAELHSSMAKGMIYAEAEHEKIVTNYEKQISKLTSDLNYINDGFEQYKNEIDLKMKTLESSIREEELNKHQNEMQSQLTEQKNLYEKQLNEQERARSDLQTQLQSIRGQIDNYSKVEEMNRELNDEIEQLRKNKEMCMLAAAQSLNDCREVITKLNQRLRKYESAR